MKKKSERMKALQAFMIFILLAAVLAACAPDTAPAGIEPASAPPAEKAPAEAAPVEDIPTLPLETPGEESTGDDFSASPAADDRPAAPASMGSDIIDYINTNDSAQQDDASDAATANRVTAR